MNTNKFEVFGEVDTFQKAKVLTGMYTVLLCDDDAAFLKELQTHVANIFSKRNDRAKIHTFTEMEGIGESTLAQCDIAILDIDFTGKRYNGIDIARRLRAARNDAVIIFLTNYIEYAPEGYEVRAFRYLLKSEMGQKIDRYLDQAIEHLAAEGESIRFQISGEIIDIPIKYILYMESQLHKVKVFVQLPNSKKIGAYTFNSPIGKVEEDLSGKGFLRIHKSYLVNMAHIQKYTCHQAELDNGMILKASAAKYAEQKAQYLLWKGELING